MPKHSKKKSEPSWVLALFAIAAPVLAAGITPLFAEEKTPESQPYVQQSSFLGGSLFDAKEFRANRRIRRDELHNRSDTSRAISSSASAVNPCHPTAPAPASAPAANSSVDALTFDDLTSTQRATLVRQLKHNACPMGVDPAYEKLCRKLLKEQGAPETRTGLANPGQ